MTNPLFKYETPDESPGLLLWQTTISWQRRIKKALEAYDISHGQFVIMAILLWYSGQNEMVTQNDIIRTSKLDKMTVSKALKKLTDMNIVSRSEHKEDTRAKIVQLTKTGTSLAKKLVPIVEEIDTDFFSKLQGKQKRDLLSILKHLTET